jgi:hypothetical protein
MEISLRQIITYPKNIPGNNNHRKLSPKKYPGVLEKYPLRYAWEKYPRRKYPRV